MMAHLNTPVTSGLVIGLVLIIPLIRIFARAGLSPAWAALVFIPWIGGFLALLVLALSRWTTPRRPPWA